MTPEKHEEFDTILNAPIPGVRAVQMWTEEEEGQDFMNMFQGG